MILPAPRRRRDALYRDAYAQFRYTLHDADSCHSSGSAMREDRARVEALGLDLWMRAPAAPGSDPEWLGGWIAPADADRRFDGPTWRSRIWPSREAAWADHVDAIWTPVVRTPQNLLLLDWVYWLSSDNDVLVVGPPT